MAVCGLRTAWRACLGFLLVLIDDGHPGIEDQSGGLRVQTLLELVAGL